MKKAELKVFKQQLVALRSRLRGDVNAMANAALNKTRSESNGDLSSMPIHMADLGSDNFEQEFTLSLMQQEGERWSRSKLLLRKSRTACTVSARNARNRSAKPGSTPSPTRRTVSSAPKSSRRVSTAVSIRPAQHPLRRTVASLPVGHSRAPARRDSRPNSRRLRRIMTPVPLNRYVCFFSLAAGGCAVDLLSKHWIFSRLGMPGPQANEWIWEPVFSLTTSLNEGALFGIGQGRVRCSPLYRLSPPRPSSTGCLSRRCRRPAPHHRLGLRDGRHLRKPLRPPRFAGPGLGPLSDHPSRRHAHAPNRFASLCRARLAELARSTGRSSTSPTACWFAARACSSGTPFGPSPTGGPPLRTRQPPVLRAGPNMPLPAPLCGKPHLPPPRPPIFLYNLSLFF